MSKYSVERIEENIAIIEFDNTFFEIDLKDLPVDIKEGDILIKDESGSFVIDTESTQQIKSKLFELQNSLFDE